MSSKEVILSYSNNSVSSMDPKIHLRDGEFLLTYAQMFKMNNVFPKGWKLELFDNINKQEPSSKLNPQIKRPRSSNIIKDYSDEDEDSFKKKKSKKIDQDYVSKEDSISSINTSSFRAQKRAREKPPIESKRDIPEIKAQELKPVQNPFNDVSKRCELIFNRLKRHPLSEKYLGNPSDPYSLSSVEKKIRANEYDTTFKFMMNVRSIWNHQFRNNDPGTEPYQNLITLSNFFEDLVKDIDSPHKFQELAPKSKEPVKEMKTVPMSVVKPIKPVEKTILQTKINYQIQAEQQNTNTVHRERSNSISERPMTSSEKNALRNRISKMTSDQQRGIINIVNGSANVEQNSKYFEFELEKLSTKKLRELEKYVKACLKEQVSGNINATSHHPNTNDNHRPSNSNHNPINHVNKNVSNQHNGLSKHPINSANPNNGTVANKINHSDHKEVKESIISPPRNTNVNIGNIKGDPPITHSSSNSSNTTKQLPPQNPPITKSNTSIPSNKTSSSNMPTQINQPVQNSNQPKRPVKKVDDQLKFDYPKAGSPEIYCLNTEKEVRKPEVPTIKPEIHTTSPVMPFENKLVVKDLESKDIEMTKESADSSNNNSSRKTELTLNENKQKTEVQTSEETKGNKEKDLFSESDDSDSDSGKLYYLYRFREFVLAGFYQEDDKQGLITYYFISFYIFICSVKLSCSCNNLSSN